MDEDNKDALEAVTSGVFGVAFRPVLNILNPPSEVLGQILALKLKPYRDRLFELGKEAERILKERGSTPKQVPVQTVLPYVNAALEEDEFLRHRWANLLASAVESDPKQPYQACFPDIMRQLSAREVVILEKLYGQIVTEWKKDQVIPTVTAPVGGNFIVMDGNDFAIAVDNLERQRLLTATMERTATGTEFPSELTTTKLGFSFVLASRPPGEAERLNNRTPPVAMQQTGNDIRLKKTQEAWTLSNELVATSDTRASVGPATQKCQKWVNENGLYLSDEAREAFTLAIHSAFNRPDLLDIPQRDAQTRKDVEENFDAILHCGKVLEQDAKRLRREHPEPLDTPAELRTAYVAS